MHRLGRGNPQMYPGNSSTNGHHDAAPHLSAQRTAPPSPAYSAIGDPEDTRGRELPGNGPVAGIEAPASKARFERDPNGKLRYTDSTQRPADDTFLTVGRRNPDGSIEESGGYAAVGFLIDLILHIGIGTGVWLALDQYAHQPQRAVFLGVLAGVTASFVHRVCIQRISQTTLGKAIFGLRTTHRDGSSVTLWELVVQWFTGAFAVIVTPLSFLG
ncbi:RDD family protein [Nocardia sp. CA-107356]|uniref:RDD family protein n=1 Tax=Nocardia sp. CA-107356 TaxID=3239972 RepID=UPI003D922EE4